MNVGTTSTYFVGVHYEVTGSSVTKYYFAGTQRIAMRKDGVLSYILGDHASTSLSTSLGSTSLVTDAAGNLLSQTKYKAWGEVRYQSGASMTEYSFTGQFDYTGSFGLMYFNARFFDPSLSRFISADSIVPPGVQGLDRYAYVNNSPLNYVDPSGHICVESDGDSDVGMAGNCGGKSNPNYKGGLQGSGWNNKIRDEKQRNDDSCLTVLCKAIEGDLLATGELILPSHFGLGVQFSFAFGFAEYLGAGFEVSASAIYYWRSDQLIVSIDGGLNGGAGVKVPIPIETSITAGPLVGWGQSSPTAGNSSIGLGMSVSAIDAGTMSVSVPATMHLNEFEIYEDPHYGVIPATIYAGVGAGCCGAGISGSATGTIYTQDVSGVLPWNWSIIK